MARKVSPKSRAIWLIRRVGRGAYPALVLVAVFAVAVAFVHDIGYDGVSERDSVSHIAEVADANRDNLGLKLQDDAKDRWRYLGACSTAATRSGFTSPSARPNC